MLLPLSSSSSTSEDEDDEEDETDDDEDDDEEDEMMMMTTTTDESERMKRRKTTAVRSASVPAAKPDNSNNSGDEESMMWFGTEDGHIHVYNSTDNIRMRKNKEKFALGFSVLDIIYNEDKVLAALSNGQVVVYSRNADCGKWNKTQAKAVSVGQVGFPVVKMVAVKDGRKIWCATKNMVKILDTDSLEIEVQWSNFLRTTPLYSAPFNKACRFNHPL